MLQLQIYNNSMLGSKNLGIFSLSCDEKCSKLYFHVKMSTFIQSFYIVYRQFDDSLIGKKDIKV